MNPRRSTPLQLPLSFETPQKRGRRSLVIEAGAGTGKTTRIVRELLSILVEEPELAAERIVLVTFTEKAAGEIAERIRQAIVDLHDTFSTGRPQWPRDARDPIFDIPPDDAARTRAAVLRHYQQLDRFYSQTIHSFCQRILTLYPLEAMLNPQFAVVEGYERTRLYEQIYAEWLQHETIRERRPEWVEDWDTALAHLNRLEAIRGTLLSFLPKRDLITDESYTLGEIDEATPEIARMIGGIRSATPAQIAAIRDETVAEAFRFFGGNPPPESPALEEWIRYLEPVSHTLAGVYITKVPREYREQMKFLRGGSGAETIYDRLRSHRVALVMRRMGIRFIKFLEKEKERRGVVDFDDLLLRTAALLRDDAILQSVRSHFDYIFVDEFQDTDRVQAEIVDKLSRDAIGRLVPGRTVIVGDPKQSIYSFRRADPETYESTVRTFLHEGAADWTLTDQFRSDPPLVDAINAMFNQLFSIPSTRNVARPQYEDLTPQRTELIRELDARITFLRCDEPEQGETDERQSVAVAEWIRARVAEGSPYRRFAVLLRKLTNVDRYLETLDRYGIPYVLPPTRAFFEKRAAVDLLAILRAIAYPFDRGAMISAARSPYFAVTDTEIARQVLSPSATDGSYAAFEERMREYAEDAPQMTVRALVDRVVDDCGIRLLYRSTPEGERDLLHLDAIREIATEFDLRTGGSVALFVDEIARRREQAEEGEPSWIDESQDAVAIMTIHAAKGLEFETVIVPDLSSGMRGDTFRIFAIDEPRTLLFNGRLENLGGEFRKSDDQLLRDIGKARVKAEIDRLFYVAVTRAKTDVVFVTDKKDTLGQFGSCLERTFAIDPKGMAERFADLNKGVIEQLSVGLRSIPAAFVKLSPTLDQAASRTRLAIDPETLTLMDDPPLPQLDRLDPSDAIRLRAGLRNKAAGIALHRVLELWDGGETTLQPLVRSVAAEQQLDEQTLSRLGARLKTAAASTFLERIRHASTVGRELPIYYRGPAGEIVEARIDRLLFDGRKHLVVDYKSGRPDPARVEKDRLQVKQYCEAIARLKGTPCSGVLWYIDLENDRVVEV